MRGVTCGVASAMRTPFAVRAGMDLIAVTIVRALLAHHFVHCAVTSHQGRADVADSAMAASPRRKVPAVPEEAWTVDSE